MDRSMHSDQHLRVSDAEREAVAGRLAEHFAVGRLDRPARMPIGALTRDPVPAGV